MRREYGYEQPRRGCAQAERYIASRKAGSHIALYLSAPGPAYVRGETLRQVFAYVEVRFCHALGVFNALRGFASRVGSGFRIGLRHHMNRVQD